MMVKMVTEMIDNAPNDQIKGINEKLLKFANDHLEVVEKFGRYPARNEPLGRESTPEELEFLKTHAGW